MGVYNRDGINYSAMLQNAIANRNAAAQRQAQYLMNKGKLWGDTATNVGKIFGRGLASSYDGVLTMKFDGMTREVNFLYKLDGGALRLEDTTGANFSGNQLRSRGVSPVIVYLKK